MIKPKVLTVIDTGTIGGPGKQLLQFIEFASKDHFEHIVCNFQITGRPYGQFSEEAIKRKIDLKVITQRSNYDPFVIFKIRNIIKNNKINIIETHGYKANLIGYILKMICDVRWIGFAHGYTDDNYKIKIYNYLDRLSLRFPDAVVAVSVFMKNILTQSGVNDNIITVIYNAIDKNIGNNKVDCKNNIKDTYGIEKHKKVVGVIGRLNPEKGQIYFLKALKIALKTYPDIIALIIGDGQDKSMLEAYCNENGLINNVIFTGYQKNIGDYYEILDILVLPSLSEGLPNTILEALAYEVPILTTSAGGIPEIINGDNGVIVPSRDEESLAEGMVKILEDNNLQDKLRAMGKSSLDSRFSSDIRAQQIIGLYNKVLG